MKVFSFYHFKIHSVAKIIFLVCVYLEGLIGVFGDNRARR